MAQTCSSCKQELPVTMHRDAQSITFKTEEGMFFQCSRTRGLTFKGGTQVSFVLDADQAQAFQEWLVKGK